LILSRLAPWRASSPNRGAAPALTRRQLHDIRAENAYKFFDRQRESAIASMQAIAEAMMGRSGFALLLAPDGRP
jgi:hypothetical protein